MAPKRRTSAATSGRTTRKRRIARQPSGRERRDHQQWLQNESAAGRSVPAKGIVGDKAGCSRRVDLCRHGCTPVGQSPRRRPRRHTKKTAATSVATDDASAAGTAEDAAHSTAVVSMGSILALVVAVAALVQTYIARRRIRTRAMSSGAALLLPWRVTPTSEEDPPAPPPAPSLVRDTTTTFRELPPPPRAAAGLSSLPVTYVPRGSVRAPVSSRGGGVTASERPKARGRLRA